MRSSINTLRMICAPAIRRDVFATLISVAVMCLGLAALITACGGGGGGAESESAAGAGNDALSGRAAKGAIRGGTVIVYSLNADGARGAILATTITDDKGDFSLDRGYSEPIEVVVTGGVYTDEATGSEVDMTGREMSVFVEGAAAGRVIAVTPLTNAAVEQARMRAAGGESLASAIAVSNRNVAEVFGLGDIDITQLKPQDLTQEGGEGGDPVTYAAVLAGLSQMAYDSGMRPEEALTVARVVGSDLADGVLDDASSMRLTETIAESVSDFLSGPRNQSGVRPEEVTIHPVRPSTPVSPQEPVATPVPTTAPTATPTAAPTPAPASTDRDGDGYPAERDCDDSDATVNPGAAERCDTVDNDCDGIVDEDFDLASDVNNCGACGQSVASDADSCTTDQCVGGAPVYTPIAGCGVPAPICTAGSQRACGPNLSIGICSAGAETCAADGLSWGACVGAVYPTQEVCGNTVDDDCDGVVDEAPCI